MELVLQELKKALVERTTVMGRILNPVNKGYAVGIGGLVCFLPVTQCLYEVPLPCYSVSTRPSLRTLFASCHSNHTPVQVCNQYACCRCIGDTSIAP